MVGFLDGKGNGGIEFVGFGGLGAFSLFFSSSLRALLCTHTHTLASPDSREFTPLFFFWQAFTFSQKLQESRIKSLIHQTRLTTFPGST